MNHSKTSYDVARADVWSLGACLYSMVTGVSTAPSHSLAKNYSSAFVFTPCVRDLLSQEIRDLLSGMLDYAPDCRYTVYVLYILSTVYTVYYLYYIYCILYTLYCIYCI